MSFFFPVVGEIIRLHTQHLPLFTFLYAKYFPERRFLLAAPGCLPLVWVNSEAKTGYVLCFQVYTGANSKTTREKGLGYRVVMDLIEHYKMKGHCLFIDNFYTSPLL